MKAKLGVKIEAVETKVTQVYAAEHKSFTMRLDSHDIRLLALEKPGPAKP